MQEVSQAGQCSEDAAAAARLRWASAAVLFEEVRSALAQAACSSTDPALARSAATLSRALESHACAQARPENSSDSVLHASHPKLRVSGLCAPSLRLETPRCNFGREKRACLPLRPPTNPVASLACSPCRLQRARVPRAASSSASPLPEGEDRLLGGRAAGPSGAQVRPWACARADGPEIFAQQELRRS